MVLGEEIQRIKNLMMINEEVGQYMDSTYLQTAEQANISDEESDVRVFNTIQDAIDHNIKLVMLRPEYVKAARQFIDDKAANVLIGTVIGFPHGDVWYGKKFDEAMEAIKNGVDELDYVVNYKAFQEW